MHNQPIYRDFASGASRERTGDFLLQSLCFARFQHIWVSGVSRWAWPQPPRGLCERMGKADREPRVMSTQHRCLRHRTPIQPSNQTPSSARHSRSRTTGVRAGTL